MGYMFASPYPWGWLPYRYGNWMFVPGFGWMWQPGGWGSYMAVPRYTATSLVTVHPLIAPTGTMKTVVVGKGGPVSTLASSRMVVKSGSAGMGIQRGSLSNLKEINHQVAKSGFAEVHPAPQFAATSHANSGFGASERGEMSGSAMHSAPAAHAAAPAGGTVHH
jgi:hypothetical protein